MPEISDNVGDGGANLKHDVALIEVMLRLIKTAKNKSYFTGDYDGAYNNATKQAIRAYQTDKALIPAAPAAPPAPAPGVGPAPAAPPAGAGAAGAERLGLISKTGPTIAQLVRDLPAAYANIRALEKTNVVYLEHTAAELAAARTSLNNATLENTFRASVLDLATQFFDRHKMALSIAGASGGLRGFQRQFELYQQGRTTDGIIVTHVGPGESNHQWGQAVDFLPNRVKWLRGNTTTVRDDWWFNQMDEHAHAKYNSFYNALIKARDALALPLGLWRLKNNAGNLMDPPHLQAYDQDNVSMARSLVTLLNAAGVGVCKWKSVGGNYHSDYGIGGTSFFNVGTSLVIWPGNAVVTKANAAKAHTEAAKAAANGGPFKTFQAADIKASEVTEIRNRLKADWVRAEAEWARWQPLP